MPATHVSGVGTPVDTLIYFGSPDADTKLQRDTDPGTDPVVISIVDADASTGTPASEIKLALSSGGLDGATGGASLTLSHTILSGAGNAVPIYTRRTSALTTLGNYDDLTLTAAGVLEFPV
jgi:hypothetical protein